MDKRKMGIAALTAVLALALTAGDAAAAKKKKAPRRSHRAVAAAPAAPRCDRACLRGMQDQYLTAVFRHDPGMAPLAATFRSTENAAEVKKGDGLWRTVTGYGEFQRRYFDPVNGQAAYLGILQEGDKPIWVTLRLRVENHKITEAEWTWTRPTRPEGFPRVQQEEMPSDAPMPKEERESREALLKAASSYFEGVEKHDGSIVQQTETCNRYEQGGRSTGWPVPPPGTPRPPASQGPAPGSLKNCADKLETMTSIAKAAYRRFPLIDEEAGMVLGMAIFERAPGAARANGRASPRNLLTEYFRVRNGKITGVYAVMYYLPAEAPDSPGWPATY